MPASAGENIEWATAKIKKLNPSSVLDVGPGMGLYGKISKSLEIKKIHAIEVWEPYIEEFNLHSIYDHIFLMDARKFEDFNYDLVIFGDVLEHMSEEDAVNLYTTALNSAKNVFFSLPIIHYPQGCHAGNPYEEHIVEDWNHERVLKTFPNIYDWQTYTVTGSYVGKKE
jgi:hypothetical protein